MTHAKAAASMRLFSKLSLAIALLTHSTPTHAEPLADSPLWGFERAATSAAWRITRGQKNIVVAIIDTGIDTQHPELKNNLWQNPIDPPNGRDDDGNGYIDDTHGWNFAGRPTLGKTQGNADLTDTHGHGTHIAGIVRKIAPQVRLMILKYYDAKGPGQNNLSNTVKAIEYAIQMKADIINYSGGGRERSQSEEAAIRKAEQAGLLFVAAAGNEKSNTDKGGFYPASYDLDNIVSVTAIDAQTRVLASSNYGARSVDIAAPGKSIYSTVPGGGHDFMTGTSQATAFVTGAAALLYSRSPKLSFAQVKKALRYTSDPRAALKEKTFYGVALDAYRALAIRDQDVDAFDQPLPPSVGLDASQFTHRN